MIRSVRSSGVFVAAVLAASAVLGAGPSAPSAAKVLATVNGEPITLGAVDAARSARATPDDPFRVLDRLIGVELVVQEGRRMGLQDSLEVSDQLGIFERDTLRDGLFARVLENVKADPKVTEKLAATMNTEVSIRSALFPRREDAASLRERALKGADFDAAAAEVTGAEKGKLDPGKGFIRLADLRPEVQDAVATLSAGQVSAVYAIDGQFAVTRLVDRRALPNPHARAEAEAEGLKRAQLVAMASYVDGLSKKYAKVNESLVAAVDFDAKEPGFDSYLSDARAAVTIEGDPPITVADLADATRKRLFHGAGRAADRGRLNRKKIEILDDLITKRVVMKEARRLGLDKKPEYVALRDEVQRELIFGMFVGKVIEQSVKVSGEDIRKYYEGHKAEFTQPEMVRLEALAFESRKAADEGLVKLRSGADLAWMRGNAPGRLAPEAVPEGLRFPSMPLVVAQLPDDVRQALQGATSGDYRVFATPAGPAAVLHVRDRIVGAPRRLAEVEDSIRRTVAGEKRQSAFDEYVLTLRKASEVRILITADELRKLPQPPKAAS